jgi:hypothetical protein
VWLIVMGFATARAGAAAAESCRAQASVDQARITIGDPIRYTLSVETSGAEPVLPAREGAAWSPFEVRRVERLVPEPPAGAQRRYQAVYTLAIFETGTQAVPAQTVVCEQDRQSVTAATQPIPVVVESVDPGGAFEDIRPLKPPVSVPLAPWVGWLGAVLACAAAAAGVIVWRAQQSPRQVAPPPPPWAAARNELAALRAALAHEPGEMKERYDRLGDTIRAYCSARYGIHGMDRTTDELLALLKERIDPTAVEEVRRCLTGCDLVKFAGMVPTIDQAQEAVRQAEAIIDRTAPREPLEALPAGGRS